MNPLKTVCPNCESARQLGKEPGWCVICADPYTQENRGWVWRWNWLHRFLVSRHNFKRLAEKQVATPPAVQEVFVPAVIPTLFDVRQPPPEGVLPTIAEQPVAQASNTQIVIENPVASSPVIEAPAVEQPLEKTSEGRSVPDVSSTNVGASESLAQHQGVDQSATTDTREGADSEPDKLGPESEKVDGQVPSAKQAAETPPSSFPELPVLEEKKSIQPKPSDARFVKRDSDAEPPLRPRKEWEKWFKRQGNPGWATHAEWKRRAKEAGIEMGEA